MLTLPTVEDLARFQHEEEVEDVEWAEDAIEQAALLFYLATGVDEDPDNPTLAKMARYAILDMAWALLIRTEEKNETFSGHASERIGSYSYTKMANNVRNRTDTGVPWFDQAVVTFAEAAGYVEISSTSENVFGESYGEYERQSEYNFFGGVD